MRGQRRYLIAARGVAEIRTMDLEESGLATALRKKQHDGRILSIRIHPGEELAINRLLQLVFGWNDESARGDEAPPADVLGHEFLKFLAAEIIEFEPWLAPSGSASRRTEQQTDQKLSPVRL